MKKASSGVRICLGVLKWSLNHVNRQFKPVRLRAWDAILEATIQVFLQVGKERLTTTKVALRAGVSVGTLYQYFPNKSALLKAALKRHMDDVTEAIELVCHEQKGHSLEQMATALMTTFLEAKMRDAKTSVALCAVSFDVDGPKMARVPNACSERL
jgi:AcrR family transcriptional regulator